MLDRMGTMHVSFFPALLDIYISPHERDVLTNARSIRKLVSEIIDKRKNYLA